MCVIISSTLTLFDSQYMMTSSNGSFFRDTGPLCGEFDRSTVNSAHKGPVMRNLYFVDVGTRMLSNKQSNDRWIEATWRSRDVIVMATSQWYRALIDSLFLFWVCFSTISQIVDYMRRSSHPTTLSKWNNLNHFCKKMQSHVCMKELAKQWLNSSTIYFLRWLGFVSWNLYHLVLWNKFDLIVSHWPISYLWWQTNLSLLNCYYVTRYIWSDFNQTRPLYLRQGYDIIVSDNSLTNFDKQYTYIYNYHAATIKTKQSPVRCIRHAIIISIWPITFEWGNTNSINS